MSIFSWLRRRPPEATAYGIARPDGTFDAPLVEGWQTLGSDLAARMYRNDMQLLFDFGAGSAIRGFKSSIQNFAHQGATARRQIDRVTGIAGESILRPIGQELLNLLALSIQGNFEKGFRRWLRNSLMFVEGVEITDDDVVKAQWSNPTQARRDLGAIMARVRGVHLTDTVEGPLLLELALIGNVVRHGDGSSARQAYQRYPYMFEPLPTDDGASAYGEHDELPERLLVTEERLAVYAQAAYQFWHRIQLAYTGDR